MNIGLTGHSRGLGKHLLSYFSEQGIMVTGFSRSNGYDIKSPFDRKKIISESKNFDVFVNLVHNYYHQADLLLELHKSWQNQKKLIISVGSKAVHNLKFEGKNYERLEYKLQKTNLSNMSKILQHNFEYPIVILYEISEINFIQDVQNLNKMIINECKILKK